MDIERAIKTMRAVRQYTDRTVTEDVITRILEAGRWAGSAKNTQPWKFIVIRERQTLDGLADCGNYASHLREAPLAIVLLTEATPRADFDSGRAIQNMMLAAWNAGVGSCIASMHREGAAKRILGIPDTVKLQQVIAFGYPRPGVIPTIEGKPLKDVLATTGRKPLEDLVYRRKWGE
jgi:nitroreductase